MVLGFALVGCVASDLTVGRWGPPGTAWASPIRAVELAFSDHLTLAADPSGDWVAAYEVHNPGAGRQHVAVRRFDAAGRVQGPAWGVRTAGGSHPQVARRDGGGFAVCWSPLDRAGVAAQALGATGRPLGSPLDLAAAEAGFATFAYCDLATNDDGTASAAWLATGPVAGGWPSVQLWRGALGAAAAPVTLTHAGGPVALAPRSDGAVAVVWQAAPAFGAPSQIHVGVVDVAGAWIAGPVMVSDPADGEAGRPDVAVTADGTVVAAWGYDGAGPGPMLATLAPDLSLVDVTALCGGDGQAIALSGGPGHVAASWMCGPVGGEVEVHALVLDATGQAVLPDTVVARPRWAAHVKRLSVIDLVDDGSGTLRGAIGWQAASPRGVPALYARGLAMTAP